MGLKDISLTRQISIEGNLHMISYHISLFLKIDIIRSFKEQIYCKQDILR